MKFQRHAILVALVAASLAAGAIFIWDTCIVTVASGHRDVTVSIVRNEIDAAASISYAATRVRFVKSIIANYPAPEPVFKSIDSDSFVLDVPFSFKVSRFGRDLGYSMAFDTLVFHVAYENRDAEFHAISIPDRHKPAIIDLKL